MESKRGSKNESPQEGDKQSSKTAAVSPIAGQVLTDQPFDEALEASTSMSIDEGSPLHAGSSPLHLGKLSSKPAVSPSRLESDDESELSLSLSPAKGKGRPNASSGLGSSFDSGRLSPDHEIPGLMDNDEKRGAGSPLRNNSSTPSKTPTQSPTEARGIGGEKLAKTAEAKEDDEASESGSSEEKEDEDEESSDEEDEEGKEEQLDVSPDIRKLFSFINSFKPQAVELSAPLKPFLPSYIPSIGEMDCHLKPPRPDRKEELLGIYLLDEPATVQSDPAVVDLQLRTLSKSQSRFEGFVVKSIEDAESNPKDIERWIKSLEEIHTSKPPCEVLFTRPMPSIDDLMEVWPEQMETELSALSLPNLDTADLSLEDMVRMVCSMLDIPIYQSSMIHSVYLLFTLYDAFKSNQHFARSFQSSEKEDELRLQQSSSEPSFGP